MKPTVCASLPDYRNRIFFKSCETMAEIPDGAVQTCVTSPPYWGLRSYHGNEGMVGLEDAPEAWVERLVDVFREVRRVLRDDGTLWVNVGDAYAGSWGAQSRGGDDKTSTLDGRLRSISDSQIVAHPKGALTGSVKRTPGLTPKDLIGLPWMLAFALRADGWYLRSDIIWAKPNCMPSSVTDRCTTSHEYIFMFAKKRRYFFDADAIREPLAESSLQRLSQNVEAQAGSDRANGGGKTNGPMKAVATGPRIGGRKTAGGDNATYSGNEWTPGTRRTRRGEQGQQSHPNGTTHDLGEQFVGANKRDVWTIATSGYNGAHFATFPEGLARLCILAGSQSGDLVLDPFMGSGTTARVALESGRDYVGYEIAREYEPLIAERLGMFYQTEAV